MEYCVVGRVYPMDELKSKDRWGFWRLPLYKDWVVWLAGAIGLFAAVGTYKSSEYLNQIDPDALFWKTVAAGVVAVILWGSVIGAIRYAFSHRKRGS